MIDLREIHDIDVSAQKVTDPAPETLEVVESPLPVPAPAKAADETSLDTPVVSAPVVKAPVASAPVDTRKALVRSDEGFTWDGRPVLGNGGSTRTRREIVANPDGPGWRWVDVEDEYAR
jgi:hypothetical protein